MSRTFTRFADLAKYRVSMKHKLRKIDCQFDNNESTETLEELMRVNNLEV